MSMKIVILGLLASFVSAIRGEDSCCQTEEPRGDFWSFKRQGDADCALNINLFDGLKLITALNHIGCKNFDTLIINGQHMTGSFVASDEDLAAIPEHTNVVYQNIQSSQIEKEETGTNLKSLNLVNAEDFSFHPSLLDETEFIEFDGVKLSYNSDERVFKMTQTEPRPQAGPPKAESLVAASIAKATGYTPSDFEVLLMTICSIQLLVIAMIVVMTCSSKAAKRRESLFRAHTSTSLTSNYSNYSSDSQYSSGSGKSSQRSVEEGDIEKVPEVTECTVMIANEEDKS